MQIERKMNWEGCSSYIVLARNPGRIFTPTRGHNMWATGKEDQHPFWYQQVSLSHLIFHMVLKIFNSETKGVKN